MQLALTLLALSAPAVSSPIGNYRLDTVDGIRVPMVWQEAALQEGGSIRLHWIAGRAEFRRDGRFEIGLTAMRTGVGLVGRPEPITIKGVWRTVLHFRIELRFANGERSYWEPSEHFSRLTLKSKYPDLYGVTRGATMVMVRE
jgi:hypothetical protein